MLYKMTRWGILRELKIPCAIPPGGGNNATLMVPATVIIKAEEEALLWLLSGCECMFSPDRVRPAVVKRAKFSSETAF